jgi:hypothetical protein
MTIMTVHGDFQESARKGYSKNSGEGAYQQTYN